MKTSNVSFFAVALCGCAEVGDLFTGGAGGAGDMDGRSEEQGDCDDCNGMVSPAGAEFLEDGVDNDCDGMTDDADPEVMPCDTSLAFDSAAAGDAVAAIGMCDKASDGTPRFVKSAKWVLANHGALS